MFALAGFQAVLPENLSPLNTGLRSPSSSTSCTEILLIVTKRRQYEASQETRTFWTTWSDLACKSDTSCLY